MKKRFSSFMTTKEKGCWGCKLSRVPAMRMNKGRVSLLFLCAECVASDERVMASRDGVSVIAGYTPEEFGFSFAPAILDERRQRVVAMLRPQ